MKNFVLNTNDLTDDFFSDARLLGIMMPAKNYRFCWLLNNTLGYNFRLNNEIDIHTRRNGRNYFFPVYLHTIPNSFLKHYIYHNIYDGEPLVKEFRNMDFLWLMKGDSISNEECSQLIQSVKNLHGVQLVTEIDPGQIKMKENLIF